MSHYDYKVVPAPKRAKKVKGIRSAEELFALTLTEAINEVARQGWEYVRAEHMPAEASRGWFRASTAEDQTVLVFRRPRETLGPRLAALRPDPEAAEHGTVPDIPAPTAERAIVDRMRRREPALHLDDPGPPEEATPLRPSSPRLGPADKS